MYILKQLFIALFFFGLFISCVTSEEQSAASQTSDSIVHIVHNDKLLHHVPAVEHIIRDAGQNAIAFVSPIDTLSPDDSILRLYRINQYKPFFLQQETFEASLAVLKSAHYDGLNPEDYHYTLIDSLYHAYTNDGIDSMEALKLEVSLSKSMVLYIQHMTHGKVDPTAIYAEWNYKKDPSEYISDSAMVGYLNSHPDALALKLRPNYSMYHSLRNLLFQVDSIESSGFNTDTIIYPGRILSLGDTSAVLLKVKIRLQSTAEYNFDSLNTVFDSKLQESVKIFQKHVGLSPTGKLDKKTFSKLNFTPAEIRAAVRVNMERFRWLSNKLPDEFILVNVADYTLRHVKDRKIVYEESVIVGRDYNKTPVFQAMLSYVEFNPYWTVPRSIATKELLPSMKKNPGYLQSHNMELFQGNTQVAIPASFSQYTEANFPFTIREKPGPKNSLGQVKLVFPNPYAIYMHDTPGKYLFDQDERSFSHGCIRLKNPVKFALHLLSIQGITQKQVNGILASGKNYPIVLTHKIPVMLVYFTCYTRPGDPRPYFFKDIYGMDYTIWKELNN